MTYGTKTAELLRHLVAQIVWDALEIEDILWKDLPIVLPPLPDVLNVFDDDPILPRSM